MPVGVVLVLGTRHGYQYGAAANVKRAPCTPAQEAAFREHVAQIIRNHQPTALAEELNGDALIEAGIGRSVLQDIAREYGLAHQFCEPDRTQRRVLGIRDAVTIRMDALMREQDSMHSEDEIARELRRQFDQREEFWCARLAELPPGLVLLVCGADHVPTISRRLESRGTHCEVIDRYWLAPADMQTPR
jgi:hypothetical protein